MKKILLALLAFFCTCCMLFIFQADLLDEVEMKLEEAAFGTVPAIGKEHIPAEDLKNEKYFDGKTLYLDVYLKDLGYTYLFPYKDCAAVWIYGTRELDIDYDGNFKVRIFHDEWSDLGATAVHVNDGYFIKYGKETIKYQVDYKLIVDLVVAANNLRTSKTLFEMSERNRPQFEAILFPEVYNSSS